MEQEIILKTVIDLQKELAEVKNLLMEQRKPLYDNEEMAKLFSVSKDTVKYWRDRGLLGFTQVGAKYFYSQKDIDDFMVSNHKSAWAAPHVDVDDFLANGHGSSRTDSIR